jgi:DNA-binding SARP family transcriptional activator
LNTLDLCQRILLQDNCWERAYRYQMLAYEKLGDHGQIARVYQRCVQVLQEELDVTPSPETRALFRELTGAD